jgi:hypothetical protein
MKPRILIFIFLALIIASCGIINLSPGTSDFSQLDYKYEEGKRKNSFNVNLTPSSDTNFIYWANSSFEEDVGGHSTIPNQWAICRTRLSPPDIQSNSQKHFKVTTNSSEGQNFVGMVVRDDNTFEHIAQRLSGRLEVDSTYEFDIDLCLSSQLVSLSRTTRKEERFDRPAILQVWGSNDICDENAQLFFETTAIGHFEWERYTIQFVPNQSYEFIILEAYYDENGPYNGNLMIDNLSPIRKVK